MNKITVTTNNGESCGWFDRDAAVLIEEGTYHDGRNIISKATQSQWTHEEIFVTAKKRLVLHSWSQWQGSHDAYEFVRTFEDAAEWLDRNDIQIDAIPALAPLAEQLAKYSAAREV